MREVENKEEGVGLEGREVENEVEVEDESNEVEDEHGIGGWDNPRDPKRPEDRDGLPWKLPSELSRCSVARMLNWSERCID